MTLDDARKKARNDDPYERQLVWSPNTRGPGHISVHIIDPVNNHRVDAYVTNEMLNNSERFVNNLYGWLELSNAIQTASVCYNWDCGPTSKLLAYCRKRLGET